MRINGTSDEKKNNGTDCDVDSIFPHKRVVPFIYSLIELKMRNEY